jgi:hypothetical protein
MVVLGGLSAKENLQYLPESGLNAVLLYDWPFQTYLPSNASHLLWQVPGYYRQMSRMPGQIAALMVWAKEQSWANSQRMSLIGVSLGAMAAPAAQRIAERQGVTVHWTVLAYGGSPIGDVLAHHPTFQQWPLKVWTRKCLNLLTRHIVPEQHLPYLHGRFLVIYGLDDQMVPKEAAQRLYNLTPDPKTEIVLKGKHLGIWHQEEVRLLHQITTETRRWLGKQGAINTNR